MGWEKCVNSTKHTKDPYHTHAFEWNVHKRRSTLYILYPSNIICCFWCCKICGKAVWWNFFLFWQMMVHLLFNATLPTLNYKLYIHQFYYLIFSNTFHNKIIAVLTTLSVIQLYKAHNITSFPKSFMWYEIIGKFEQMCQSWK